MNDGLRVLAVTTLVLVASVGVVPVTAVRCADCAPGTGDVASDRAVAISQNQSDRGAGGPLLHVTIFPQPVLPKAGETVVLWPFLTGASYHEVALWNWEVAGIERNRTAVPFLTHEFTEPGQHVVNLTVVHESGTTTTRSVTLLVEEDRPPVVNFDYTPSKPDVGDTIEFSGIWSHDPDGAVIRMEWYVDNKSQPVDVKQRAEYVFTKPGNHTVELRVFDNAGNANTETTTVDVNPDLLKQVELLVDEFWMSFISFLIGVVGTIAGCYRMWT